MDKVFVVALHSGSYSDYSMELVSAFLDSSLADEHCEMLQKQIDRHKLATKQKYDHMRVWYDSNFTPDLNRHEKQDFHRISAIKENNRSAKDNERLKDLQQQWNNLSQEREEYNKSRLDEENRFIRSLDFLTDEDKEALTNKSLNSFYRTDGSYSVEEVELKG
jgi:hypothetical protein